MPAPFRNGAVDAPYEEFYVARALQVIRDGASDKISLHQSDIDKTKTYFLQTQRGQQIGKLMAMDADHDQAITHAEIVRFYKSAPQMRIDNSSTMADISMKRFDADKDGKLTLKEIGTLDESDPAVAQAATWWKTLADFMAIDPDRDGVLTIDELTLLARRSFRTLDTNHDGILSDAERKHFNQAAATLKQ